MPLSSKLSALSTVSRASDSLRSLKDIYDRDCEMAKAAEQAVAAAQIKLTEAQARQMQLDKALRRVERKWTAGVATEAELEKIQSLRKESSEARLNRLGWPLDGWRIVGGVVVGCHATLLVAGGGYRDQRQGRGLFVTSPKRRMC